MKKTGHRQGVAFTAAKCPVCAGKLRRRARRTVGRRGKMIDCERCRKQGWVWYVGHSYIKLIPP